MDNYLLIIFCFLALHHGFLAEGFSGECTMSVGLCIAQCVDQSWSQKMSFNNAAAGSQDLELRSGHGLANLQQLV